MVIQAEISCFFSDLGIKVIVICHNQSDLCTKKPHINQIISISNTIEVEKKEINFLYTSAIRKPFIAEINNRLIILSTYQNDNMSSCQRVNVYHTVCQLFPFAPLSASIFGYTSVSLCVCVCVSLSP